jgi:hypothetical protein
MKKVYIEIRRRGDDCGHVVQYAYSVKQAQLLIEKVLPSTLPGYFYTITK